MRTAGCFRLVRRRRRERAARSCDILDHDGLAERSREALADDAGHGVGVAAGRVRHHGDDRPRRPIAGLRRAREKRERADGAQAGRQRAQHDRGRFDGQAMADKAHERSPYDCGRTVRAAGAAPPPRCIFRATGQRASTSQVSFSARLRGHHANGNGEHPGGAHRQCKKPPRQCRGGFWVRRDAFASLIS
jgi:hypothetical protein